MVACGACEFKRHADGPANASAGPRHSWGGSRPLTFLERAWIWTLHSMGVTPRMLRLLMQVHVYQSRRCPTS